jgi:ribonuclease VapC
VMVVDASAILAVALGESDADVFDDALSAVDRCLMSAVNYWEVLVRLQVLQGDSGRIHGDALLRGSGVDVVPADAEMAVAAAVAHARFRGRPARLNMGDCFAYALAQREGDGLLFKGDDFPRTDVKSALAP